MNFSSSHFGYHHDIHRLRFARGSAEASYTGDYLIYDCGEIFYVDSGGERISLNITIEIVECSIDTYVLIELVGDENSVFLGNDNDWQSGYPLTKITEPQTIRRTSDPLPFTGNLKLWLRIDNDEPYNAQIPHRVVIDTEKTKIELTCENEFLERDDDTIDGNTNSNYIPEPYECTLGGSGYSTNAVLIYRNLLYSYSAGEYTRIRYYETTKAPLDEYSSWKLTSILGQRIALMMSKPQSVLSATLKCHFTPLTQPVYLQKMFQMLSYEYSMKHNVWTIEAFQVDNYEEIFLEFEQDTDVLEIEQGSDDLLVIQ